MKKSTITQNRILDVAEALFLTQPVQKISMNQIATQANVAKGTVYLYFESKDDLVWAVIERFFQDFMGIMARLNVSRVALETIDTIIDAIFDFVLDHEKEMYVLHQASFHSYLGKARIEKKYKDLWLSPIEQWFEEGVRQGLFQISNVAFYVEFIQASIHGVFDAYIMGEIDFDHQTIRAELKEIIRKLLR